MKHRQSSSLPDITKSNRGSTLATSQHTSPQKATESSPSPTKFKRLSMMETTTAGFMKYGMLALTPMAEESRLTLRTRVPLFKSTDLDDVKRRLTIKKKQPYEPDSRQYSFLSREEELVKPEQHSKFVYEQAHDQFYSYYHNMERVRQKEKEQQGKESPFHTILRYIALFNLPPKTYDMIKQKGDERRLELARLGLGRSPTLNMIAKVVDELDRFKVLNLSQNDIGPESAAIFICRLKTLIQVDLSFNSIGLFGVREFAKQFRLPNCRIQNLNLEKNNLNDKATLILVESLRNHGMLKILNLSQNYLSMGTSNSLREWLAETEELEELYLHWCELDKSCGARILDGLNRNKTLKVLDMSWNKIGSNKETLIKLASIFENNTNLVHMDISYCQISYEESRALAESLEDNNTLTGLHFEGNHGYINRRGYLIVQQKKKLQVYPTPMIPRTTVRRIRSTHFQPEVQASLEGIKMDSEICWICMGWQEVYFRIEKQSEEEQHFLHLSIEQYTGIKLAEKEDYLQCYRIVPAGVIDFFFTLGKTAERIFLSDTFPQKPVELVVKDLTKGENTLTNVKVQQVNSITVSRECEIFNEYYQYQFSKASVYVELPIRAKDLKIIGRRGLNFATSYFRNWKMQTKRTLDECLAYDIKNSKTLKVLKKETDLHECSKVLREHYQTIRNVYTLFASKQISSESNYGISSLTAMNFGRQFGYINKKLPDALYEIKFITSLTKDGQKLTDPNKLMVRSSFVEFLVRLAEQKYVRGKFQDREGKQIKYTYAQGVLKLIEKLTAYDSVYNFTQWRTNRYWNQDNDKLLKAFRGFTQGLYEKYAGTSLKVRKKGEACQLSLLEFKQIFTDVKINTNNEIDTDLNICYDLSKMLMVDEATIVRKINSLEFAEALARFADKRNFFPIGYTEDSFSDQQIQVLPLCMKLEGLLFKLLECNRELSNPKLDRFTKRSLFTQEVMQFQFVTNRLSPFNSTQSRQGFVSFLKQHSKIKINSLEQRKIETGQQISQLKFELEKEDRLKRQAQRRIRKMTSIASSENH